MAPWIPPPKQVQQQVSSGLPLLWHHTFSSPHACCRPQQCWGRARRYQKPTPDILCPAFFLTYTSIEGVSVRYAYDREGRHLRHLLSQLQHVRSHILGSKESVFWPPKVPHLPIHESKLETCSIFEQQRLHTRTRREASHISFRVNVWQISVVSRPEWIFQFLSGWMCTNLCCKHFEKFTWWWIESLPHQPQARWAGQLSRPPVIQNVYLLWPPYPSNVQARFSYGITENKSICFLLGQQPSVGISCRV